MSDNLENNNLITRWLDGSLTQEEKEQLERDGELDALRAVIDDIDTWKVEKFDVDAGLKQLQERKQKPTLKKKKYSNWIRIAASIAILISSYLFWNQLAHRNSSIATKIAENKTIELPEGSVIQLDALSKVTYKKKGWETNRSVELSGQAFFDVTSGETFTVTTSNATVTVLGTQFNIKVAKEQFLIRCYEGKVKVTLNDQEEIITVGETAALLNGKLVKSQHQHEVPNWTKGYSKYDKTYLSEIIADLQKYYPITIELPEKYQQLKYTGTISHKDLNLALNSLFTPMEINYIFTKEGNIILD